MENGLEDGATDKQDEACKRGSGADPTMRSIEYYTANRRFSLSLSFSRDVLLFVAISSLALLPCGVWSFVCGWQLLLLSYGRSILYNKAVPRARQNQSENVIRHQCTSS